MSRVVPELDRKGLRHFAWMFATLVASLFGVILPWFLQRDWPWEPWAIAAAFFAWGLMAPSSLRGFYRLWMRFGLIMNAVMTRIILGVVFYSAILPFGLIFRLRGNDPMDRKWDHELQSYRVASRATSASHMERPF